MEEINNIKLNLEDNAVSESGQFYITLGGGNASTTSMINFSQTFNTIPTVIIASSNTDVKYTIKEVSKGGFTLYLYHTQQKTREGYITWNATADIV